MCNSVTYEGVPTSETGDGEVGAGRVNVSNVLGWEEGGYPALSLGTPWWPYYPRVYALACAPGWTSACQPQG